MIDFRRLGGHFNASTDRKKSRIKSSKVSVVSIESNEDVNIKERSTSLDMRLLDSNKYLERHIIDNLMRYLVGCNLYLKF